jgi:hypothetical protein
MYEDDNDAQHLSVDTVMRAVSGKNDISLRLGYRATESWLFSFVKLIWEYLLI